MTKCFQAARKSVAGEALAVEVDGFEGAAFLVVVVQATAVGQAAVTELAASRSLSSASSEYYKRICHQILKERVTLI